jgi:hypothetical protein
MRAKGLDIKAMDQILAQQVRCKSKKNKVKNTCRAETVAAAAAMLVLSNISRGHDWQATEARGEGENVGGRGRQQQGRTCPKPFTGIEEYCLGEVYKSRSRLSKCDCQLIMDLVWFKVKKQLKRERVCIA